MCFHKWTKWEVIEEGEIIGMQSNKKKGNYYIQQRKCDRCGLIKRVEKRMLNF